MSECTRWDGTTSEEYDGTKTPDNNSRKPNKDGVDGYFHGTIIADKQWITIFATGGLSVLLFTNEENAAILASGQINLDTIPNLHDFEEFYRQKQEEEDNGN